MTPREAARAIALENYATGILNEDEFERDYNMFTTVKKMISRFLTSGKLNDKLIVNNVVICLNIFGAARVNAIFRLVTDDVEFSVVKAILMFLHQYDYSLSPDVSPNRIMVDLLRDVSTRYNLEHISI